jgi:DNA-binding transcriptional LysR family regulator
MDRLQCMKVFARVVEAGSFSRAAERLDMSNAAVTRHLAHLESVLAARLLNRSTRKLSLTAVGTSYYERCVQILADIEEAESGVSEQVEMPRGILRVNAPVSFATRHIAPLLAEYCERYPLVTVDIAISDRIVDIVEEGYDLAIRITQSPAPMLVARRLAPARMVLCAAPSYLKHYGTPRTPKDLEHHACLNYSYLSTGSTWQFTGKRGPVSVRIKGPLVANNGDVLHAALLQGMGITLQPSFIAGEDLKAGRLIPLLPGYQPPLLDIYAVYASRRHLSAKVRTFIDFLVGRFGDPPYWDEWNMKPARTKQKRPS